MYYSFYTEQPPEILRELAQVPEMKRLAGVGMNCGCEYTGYDRYKNIERPYVRLEHSIGVSYIIWNFTKSETEAAAGLLHDIAAPAFSHTVDFINYDYLMQESTEQRTEEIIQESPQIRKILHKYGILPEEVWDYHKYPIADNDTPGLSADRLEYTFGTAHFVYKEPWENIEEIYRDIGVTKNENGIPELYFHSIEKAEYFTKLSLRNSHGFVSDEDRYAMERLAHILRQALRKGCIGKEDLHKTEKEVIEKLCRNGNTEKLWKDYTAVCQVQSSREKPEGVYAVNVPAKKRYIDCLVNTAEGICRISQASPKLGRQIGEFLDVSFDRWLYEERKTE